MNELFSQILTYPKAIELIIVSLLVVFWDIHVLVHLRTKKIKIMGTHHEYYIYYSIGILIWILSNCYFHTGYLISNAPEVAITMALIANISAHITCIYAFLFSCKLKNQCINRTPPRKVYIFAYFLIVYTITVNSIPGLTVKGIDIRGVSDFTLHFGSFGKFFIISIVVLILFTFINLLSLRKINSPLKRTQINYMITGMIIFMTSMAIIQGLIAVFFGNFSLTWLPPVMSVTEMIFMGYALVTSRFYSSRYMLYFLLSNITTGLILYLPLVTIVTIDRNHFNIIALYTLITGLVWKTILIQVKPYISLIFYRSNQTPSEKIHQLIDEFKTSPHDALEKLAHLLNVPENRMQLVKKSPDNELFDRYFSKNNDILILEELLDKINTTKGKETLNKLHKKMNQNDAAFIMPMFNSADTVSHYLISTHKNNGKLFSAEEITALKKVFREAQFYINADLQLKQAQSLAHSIAHEMRNPLTQLQLHFEKLQIKIDDHQPREVLTDEINQGKLTIGRGKQLINMILREVSHSSLAQESMTVSSINRLLLQAMNQFGFESKAIRSRVHLHTGHDFTVRANDTLFNFVVFNLLRNAIYYFEAYPASTLEISTHQSLQQNKVIFRDTGPGIPEHVLKQIFEDFYSYHKQGGSGLGLSYCKRVMNSFGGTIECYSQYGQYTEFHLIFPSLPLEASVDEAEQEGAENNIPADSPEPDVHHVAKEKTILVVDDNKMQRTLVQLFVQQLGYQILHADNGNTALDIFRHNQVDLVIMDIQMPVMNGFEATTEIKALSPDTPVIALSGESGEKELQLIQELMDGRLTKPTSKAELQKMLSQFLNSEYNSNTIIRTLESSY